MQAGSLELRFALLHGSSKILHSLARAPFKIQRPFYPEGEKILHLYILHTAGGIVGGDLLQADIELQERSNVLLTSATACKVYRSLGEVSRQNIVCHLAKGTCLEWLPQETILFNGAIYHQKIQIELSDGAVFFGWDINRYGRTARGERYLSGNYHSNIQVNQNGRPIWIDRQNILGNSDFIDSPNTLNSHSVLGTLVLLGVKIESSILEQLQEIDQYQSWGLTPLKQGLLCRYRGNSTQDARLLFKQIWAILRPFYLGIGIPNVRIWQ